MSPHFCEVVGINGHRLATVRRREQLLIAELLWLAREDCRCTPGPAIGARLLLLLAKGVSLWAWLRR